MSKAASNLNHNKLIDRLPPGPAAGRLLGILATTYEMQADFFETDFLPTLLGLGAWDDHNWTSRIALERQLAELESAALLIDAHPYRGRPRSLRLDVVPVSLGVGRILHAKVLCCVFEDAVRLIVGSANLTEPGYRKNREVVAVLTASARQPTEALLIAGALRELDRLLQPWLPQSSRQLQSLALERLDAWSSATPPADQFILWGGGERPLWRQFLDCWPSAERVERISIVSPFWSEELNQGPISTFLSALAQRQILGDDAELLLLTEAAPDSPGAFKPKLPESFQNFDARTLGVHAQAVAVAPDIPRQEAVDLGLGKDFTGLRSLHAKIVLLEGANSSLVYLGSANFTRHGWGFLPRPETANIEAGLAVMRTGSSRSALHNLLPATSGAAVPLAGAAAGKFVVSAPSADELPWPTFLSEVLLVPSEQDSEQLDLSATVTSSVSGPWKICLLPSNNSIEVPLLDVAVPEPGNLGRRTSLSQEHLRRLLQDQEVLVRWWQCPEGRNFPINVAAAARLTLPISPGSGRPEERHLISYYQGKLAWEDLFPDPEPGPERGERGDSSDDSSGVDTSRIQSYLVREFVEALKGIKDDLKAAAKSPPTCMRLALLGSVSPVALAKRIIEAVEVGERTPTASGFQLVEILACVVAARGFETGERFREDWSLLTEEASGRIVAMLGSLQLRFPDELSQEFRRYEQAVRKHHKKQVGTR